MLVKVGKFLTLATTNTGDINSDATFSSKEMKDFIDMYRKKFGEMIEKIWTIDKMPPFSATANVITTGLPEVADYHLSPHDKHGCLVEFLKHALENTQSKDLIEYAPTEAVKIHPGIKKLKRILSKM